MATITTARQQRRLIDDVQLVDRGNSSRTRCVHCSPQAPGRLVTRAGTSPISRRRLRHRSPRRWRLWAAREGILITKTPRSPRRERFGAKRQESFFSLFLFLGDLGALVVHTFFRPRSKSAIRSPVSSIPTDRRSRSGGTGLSGGSMPARCSIRLSTPPSEVARLNN